VLAAEPLAAGADDVAAEAAAADDDGAAAADVLAVPDDAGLDGADDPEFLELLQPAVNIRPDTATVAINLFSGRTVVLQVV
jgi:hypothetical protein